MKRFLRFLLYLEIAAGVTSVLGGLGLMYNGLGLPVSRLQDTPFPNYFFPGLILLVIVGGSNLYAAYHEARRTSDAFYASALAGLIMIIWIGTQVFVMQEIGLLQEVYFAVGFVILLLSFSHRHKGKS